MNIFTTSIHCNTSWLSSIMLHSLLSFSLPLNLKPHHFNSIVCIRDTSKLFSILKLSLLALVSVFKQHLEVQYSISSFCNSPHFNITRKISLLVTGYLYCFICGIWFQSKHNGLALRTLAVTGGRFQVLLLQKSGI